MSSLILIRHGESFHNITGLTGGWTDTDLTDHGKCQAVLLAERLNHELSSIKCQLYCSPLKRACQTAEIIGKELDLKPHLIPELKDVNNGIAEGKTIEMAKRLEIPRKESYLDWQRYPGSETYRQFYHRATNWIDPFMEIQPHPVIMVTHQENIHCIVTWWLQFDIDSLMKLSFVSYPTSITVLKRNIRNERTLERLNDTAHLLSKSLSEKINLKDDL